MDEDRETSLAQALGALGSPTRLALLRSIRAPRILADIEVRHPERPEGGAIARQSVRRHLDQLIEAGLASARPVRREYGETVEFLVNHQAIYSLAEDVRDLAALRPLVEPEGATVGAPGIRAHQARGPCLVVAKGLEEGVTFDLTPPKDRPSEWIIGRRRGLHVSLDFDPYVSAENTRIAWTGDAHTIEDIPGSRNGTRVNFQPLARGARHRLRHGDLIGVGRSVLAYWA